MSLPELEGLGSSSAACIALSGGSMDGGSYWVTVQGSAVCCEAVTSAP